MNTQHKHEDATCWNRQILKTPGFNFKMRRSNNFGCLNKWRANRQIRLARIQTENPLKIKTLTFLTRIEPVSKEHSDGKRMAEDGQRTESLHISDIKLS